MENGSLYFAVRAEEQVRQEIPAMQGQSKQVVSEMAKLNAQALEMKQKSSERLKKKEEQKRRKFLEVHDEVQVVASTSSRSASST